MNDKELRNGDRHTSPFMVRLPLLFRSKLQELKERTGQPMTVLIVQALKQYLAGYGLWKRRDDKVLEGRMD
jgi:predicted transcriptional regulator